MSCHNLVLNALRNPVASEMFSRRGTCRVWGTSSGSAGHLGSLDAAAVWQSVDLVSQKQHTGSWRRTIREREREVGATASLDGLFRENWLFLM